MKYKSIPVLSIPLFSLLSCGMLDIKTINNAIEIQNPHEHIPQNIKQSLLSEIIKKQEGSENGCIVKDTYTSLDGGNFQRNKYQTCYQINGNQIASSETLSCNYSGRDIPCDHIVTGVVFSPFSEYRKTVKNINEILPEEYNKLLIKYEDYILFYDKIYNELASTFNHIKTGIERYPSLIPPEIYKKINHIDKKIYYPQKNEYISFKKYRDDKKSFVDGFFCRISPLTNIEGRYHITYNPEYYTLGYNHPMNKDSLFKVERVNFDFFPDVYQSENQDIRLEVYTPFNNGSNNIQDYNIIIHNLNQSPVTIKSFYAYYGYDNSRVYNLINSDLSIAPKSKTTISPNENNNSSGFFNNRLITMKSITTPVTYGYSISYTQRNLTTEETLYKVKTVDATSFESSSKHPV